MTTTPTQSNTASPAATTPDRNAVRQEVPVNPETGKPYINTVAAVAIAPSGVGAELSEYVSQAVAVIRDSGLPNETNAVHQHRRRSGRCAARSARCHDEAC